MHEKSDGTAESRPPHPGSQARRWILCSSRKPHSSQAMPRPWIRRRPGTGVLSSGLGRAWTSTVRCYDIILRISSPTAFLAVVARQDVAFEAVLRNPSELLAGTARPGSIARGQVSQGLKIWPRKLPRAPSTKYIGLTRPPSVHGILSRRRGMWGFPRSSRAPG